jgi:hypothetical protein
MAATTKAEAFESVRNKYVFILSDNQDSIALLPVIQKLYMKGEIPRVLTLGHADLLVQKNPRLANYFLYNIEEAQSPFFSNTTSLDEAIITKTVKQFPEAKYAISGVLSIAQKQLLEAFAKRGAKTIAYWDSLSSDGYVFDAVSGGGKRDPYFEIADACAGVAQKVLVSCQNVAESPKFASRAATQLAVVGSPSLEFWTKKLAKMKAEPIQEKLDLSPTKKTILILGSQDAQYEKSFQLMVESLTKLQELFSFKLLVMPHPKNAMGLFEQRELFASYIADWKVISPDDHISAMEALRVSDTLLTYDSAMAVVAQAAGKQVIFAIPEKDPYTNLLLDKNLAVKIQIPREFVEEMLFSKYIAKDVFQEFGIPQNSADLILQEIQNF